MIAPVFMPLQEKLQSINFITYMLAFLVLATFLFLSLPIGLTALEDNVDGMDGYIWFFLLRAAIGFVLLMGLVAIVYLTASPAIRTTLILTFTTLIFTSGFYAVVYTKDYGVLDNFVFSKPEPLAWSLVEVALDFAVLVAAAVLSFALLVRQHGLLVNILVVLLLSNLAYAGLSLRRLADNTSKSSDTETAPTAKFFNFSQHEKNVVLLFLDGAMSGYIPDILREDPSLSKAFAGFTWYANTVSTGNRTINGLPAVFGGFDYTVSAINAKPGRLKDKVSAAYAIYADNFSAKGFDVLYSDPFWFGFVRNGDCELFDQMFTRAGKGRCIHSIGKSIAGRRRQAVDKERAFSGRMLQYIILSLFKSAFLSLRGSIYDDGKWLGWSYAWKQKEEKYLNNYLSLEALRDVSMVDARRATFTFLTNEVTRAPLMFGDTCLRTATHERISTDLARFGDLDTVAIFQTHKCALQSIARYLDWLRRQGVYDNTMFVIASDHGWRSNNPVLTANEHRGTYSMFQSLLMIKPLGASGDLHMSNEFIANANVPGVICETIGGCIDGSSEKIIRATRLNGPVLLHETPWQPSGQTENKFVVEHLHEVKEDIRDSSNWKTIE